MLLLRLLIDLLLVWRQVQLPEIPPDWPLAAATAAAGAATATATAAAAAVIPQAVGWEADPQGKLLPRCAAGLYGTMVYVVVGKYGCTHALHTSISSQHCLAGISSRQHNRYQLG
jgi:hypothetical protein